MENMIEFVRTHGNWDSVGEWIFDEPGIWIRRSPQLIICHNYRGDPEKTVVGDDRAEIENLWYADS